MKKRPVDFERAVVAHHQTAEIPQPREGALYRPASFVAPQNAAILRRSAVTVQAVRGDQQNAPPPQSLAQRIAVVALVSNDPQRFLPRTPRVMPSAYADRRERRFREPDFRRGRRTKVVPQRNSAAVDHHHPLRPLAPLGFSDFGAPFLAGAKLPSRNDSLHSSSRRWFNSLRNARQIFNQTPCSSQSRSRRQHVEGCGYFSGKSCQRAPLRRIHRIPSSTRRFSIHGRPPLRCLGGLGSKGAIFFHCASVSNGPARAIDPPAALLTLLIHDFAKLNHHLLNSLYWVVQQLLVFSDPKWDWHRFNAATDIDLALRTDKGLLEFTDPNLKPFFDRGGKLLMYHGWADPQVTPMNSVNYFNDVVRKLGAGVVGKSIELYMVPGMNHCGGGPGTDTFNKMAAIEQWVAGGTAPKQILASHLTNRTVDRTRPLCPYPQVASYKGGGSTDDAANFVCKAP